jgi:hypothetical protein
MTLDMESIGTLDDLSAYDWSELKNLDDLSEFDSEASDL